MSVQLCKEVRYAQRLVYASVMLGAVEMLVDLMIGLHLGLFLEIVAAGGASAILLVQLFLGWQLGRLRSWARVILLIFASLNIVVVAETVLRRFFFGGPNLGSVLYQFYYYGVTAIGLVISILLLYSLTRPVVRDTFRQGRNSRASASGASQHRV